MHLESKVLTAIGLALADLSWYNRKVVNTALPSPLPPGVMTKATDRRAYRAGMTVKKCRRGTVYSDPVTGKSVYDGNRSRKSPGHERRIESFISRRERGGVR